MRILVVALILLLASCGQDSNDKSLQTQNEQTQAVENLEEKEPEAQPKIDYATLSDAIDGTKPDMADFAETSLSKGAIILAYWATEHLKWGDLQKIKSTKHALVMKDPDAERGEKICVYGHIVEIQVDNTMPNKIKIYFGGMFDASMQIYRFIAVGSTGDLVGGSQAKFCGIVTGKNDYQNSNGGVAHAVHLVGMFDLPENK